MFSLIYFQDLQEVYQGPEPLDPVDESELMADFLAVDPDEEENSGNKSGLRIVSATEKSYQK